MKIIRVLYYGVTRCRCEKQKYHSIPINKGTSIMKSYEYFWKPSCPWLLLFWNFNIYMTEVFVKCLPDICLLIYRLQKMRTSFRWFSCFHPWPGTILNLQIIKKRFTKICKQILVKRFEMLPWKTNVSLTSATLLASVSLKCSPTISWTY